MMNALPNTVSVAVITGLTVSLVFAVIMAHIKPRLDISPSISEFLSDDGRLEYEIKVYNKSRFFEAMRIHGEFLVFTDDNILGKDGTVRFFRVADIDLRRPDMMRIGRLTIRKPRGDDPGDYAFRFTAYDIKAGRSPERHRFEVRVYAEHSFTGYGRVFTMRYGWSQIHRNKKFLGGATHELRDLTDDEPRIPLS